MEFLMTYGWAILVVLAAIGALAYFGVLSPDRFLPDKCTANPPFACTQYKVTADNVFFSLQNSAGVDVTLNYVNITCDGGTSSVNTTGNGSAIVRNGDSVDIQWLETAIDVEAGCNTWNSGEKFKAVYDISYTKSGETVSHIGSGSIQVRAED